MRAGLSHPTELCRLENLISWKKLLVSFASIGIFFLASVNRKPLEKLLASEGNGLNKDEGGGCKLKSREAIHSSCSCWKIKKQLSNSKP